MYADSKDLAKKTVLDKVLKDRVYEIALNPQYDAYQRGFANIVNKVFDEKVGSEVIATSKVGLNVNEVLAQ